MNYKEAIERYAPCCEQEAADKELMLSLIRQFPDTVLTRDCAFAHMTASGFIVNEARDKTLMAYHNIYQSWAWTGGHADGDGDLLAVALREAREETGILQVAPLSGEIDCLDILTVCGHVKRGRHISAHLHLSPSYLLVAPEEQKLTVKADENSGVRWIPLDRLSEFCTEAEMLPVYQKLIDRMRRLP